MNKRRYYESEYYVQGNTVRKRQLAEKSPDNTEFHTGYRTAGKERAYADALQTAPVRRRRTESPKQPQQTTITGVLPAQNWDIPSLLFIVGAVAVAFFMCISYLEAQESITAMSKKVATLESEILSLKNENDAAYNRIDSLVDLQYVYDVAVNELGMVHASDSQVISYNSKKSNSVRQYGEIPAETESGYSLSGK